MSPPVSGMRARPAEPLRSSGEAFRFLTASESRRGSVHRFPNFRVCLQRESVIASQFTRQRNDRNGDSAVGAGARSLLTGAGPILARGVRYPQLSLQRSGPAGEQCRLDEPNSCFENDLRK